MKMDHTKEGCLIQSMEKEERQNKYLGKNKTRQLYTNLSTDRPSTREEGRPP